MEDKQFISEEYEQEKYVLNMIWFTIFSLIILVFFTLIFGIPFYNAWKINNNENIFPIIINTNYRIIFLIICILGLFIHAWAESFLSLRDSEENIDKILYRIACGNFYYPNDVETALDRDCLFKVNGKLFTKREREIMKLCVPGNTNADIAKILSITVSTVKFHKGNIYKKVGGNKNNDILGKAIKYGIISLKDFE